MALLEIACYQVSSTVNQPNSHPWLKDAPYDKPTALLRHCLTEGLRASRRSSKSEHHLLQDVQDTHTVYHIGRWTTLHAFREYSESEEHTLLLQALEYCNVRLSWKELFEAGLGQPHHTLDFFQSLLDKKQRSSHAPVVSIGRYEVTEANKAPFRSQWADIRTSLHRSSGYEPIIGHEVKTGSEVGSGRTDTVATQDSEAEQYVVLCGWASHEQYTRLTDHGRAPQLQSFRVWARQWDESCADMIALE